MSLIFAQTIISNLLASADSAEVTETGEALTVGKISHESMSFFTKEIAGFPVHVDTVVFTWGIMLVLIILAVLARKKIGLIPTGLANLFELIFEYFDNLAFDMTGKNATQYVPTVVTIFLFVLFANWVGLIPTFLPPSRDYNTTLALACIAFLSFNIYGIQSKIRTASHKNKGILAPFIGLKNWLLHFIEPTPLIWNSLEGPMKYIMTPILMILFLILNIIEELARIVSLSVRLFGNVMGEHLVVGILLVLMFTITIKFLVPVIWISSLFVVVLGTLTGFIQAFIFAVLTLSYISHAVEEEH